jgi:hypothetical protein
MRLPAVLIALLAALGLALGSGGMAPSARAAEPCPMHAGKAADHRAPPPACAACCCLVVAAAEIAASPAAPVAQRAELPGVPLRLDRQGRTIQPGHGPPRASV